MAKYYHGLVSQPRLIARSNWQTDWHLRTEDNHVVKKHIRVIGRHAIVDAWNNTSLRDDIIDILSSRIDTWNCLDVLRIGYEDEVEEAMAVIL